MKMNTPTAIFLGLALIAAAIFFRQPSISEAKAGIMGGGGGIILKGMTAVTQLKGGKIRFCTLPKDKSMRIAGWTWLSDSPLCGPWSD